MLVYLQAPGRPSLHRIVLIGILIAGGTLFRRHLAYPGLAVYAAIGVDRIWLALTAFSAWRPRSFRILRDGLIFAIAPLVTVIVMYVISPEFTKHAITENYAVLYNSYRLSVGQILSTMRSVLGLLIVILVAAGYAVGLITGSNASAADGLRHHLPRRLACYLVHCRPPGRHAVLHACLPGGGRGRAGGALCQRAA